MKSHLSITSIICLIILVTGTARGQELLKSAEMKRLTPLIGHWITIGTTVGDSSSKPLAIRASDIYEWARGGGFVIHHMYGLIGNQEVGGVEILGYDAQAKAYKSYFFDYNGNFSTGKMICNNGVFSWEGPKLRGSGEFSRDGKVWLAHHQRLTEKGEWAPAMEVTLSKVE